MNEILKAAVKPLLKWYATEKRSLPWRERRDPYAIWLSEIMLQQTRIEAVLPRYDAFLEAFPTIEALAAADGDEVRKAWQGLGYYRRADQLHLAAQVICEKYAGQLPADYDALRKLPGIGRYTAGAIASIGFGLPHPAVDGNVLRVVARLLADGDDVTEAKTQRKVESMLQSVIPQRQPGDFNQAVMELGERICLPNTVPLCNECPVSDICVGRCKGVAADLPRRAAKKQRRQEKRTVLVHRCGDLVAIRKRPARGLLANLWEFPNEEGQLKMEDIAGRYRKATVEMLGSAKHIFTHIEWHMIGFRIWHAEKPPLPDSIWANAAEIDEIYAIPTAMRFYAKQAFSKAKE